MKRSILVAVASAAVWGGLSTALAQDSVQLRNAAGGDGSLEIWPDAFGAWSQWGGAWTQNFDLYDPQGSVGPANLSFGANLMIYDPANLDREALAMTDPILGDINDFYNLNGGGWGAGTLRHRILPDGGLVASDTNNDGLDDTANSSFWVFGTVDSGDPTLRLTFDLEQKVTGPDANGVATYTKTYTVTNIGANAVSIQLEQHDDFDLGWDGDFKDPAGADSAGGFRNPYMQEPSSFAGNASTKVALSGSGGSVYSAGRTTDPAQGGPDPPYNFGSDGSQWRDGSGPDIPGFPPSWTNHVAYIGADMDGIVLDLQPPLGMTPWDGQMNLMWEIALEPEDVCEIVIVHTYGSSTPLEPGLPTPACVVGGGCPDPCDMNCDGTVNSFDIEPFLGLLFDGDDPCCGVRGDVGSAGDTNGDGAINSFDIEPFLACLFP